MPKPTKEDLINPNEVSEYLFIHLKPVFVYDEELNSKFEMRPCKYNDTGFVETGSGLITGAYQFQGFMLALAEFNCSFSLKLIKEEEGDVEEKKAGKKKK